MTMKKRGLGRGLDVLLPSRTATTTREAEVVSVPVTALQPNKHQPRQHFSEEALQELAASVALQGVLQPVLVRPAEKVGRYEIIAGERRWRACQLAGHKEVPCLIRQVSIQESMALALVENIQREDLNPMEEARALGQIKEHFQNTQEELAGMLGKSRPAIANSLRLLQLPPMVQTLLEEGALSAGHARALLALDDPAAIEMLARTIQEKQLTVRETEALVRNFQQQHKVRSTARRPQSPPEDLAEISKELHSKHALSVTCRGTKKRGQVILRYASPEERERIARALQQVQFSEEL